MVNTTQTPAQVYPTGVSVDKADVIRFENEIKAGFTNSGKTFASRAAAVSFGHGNLPASLGQIETREGNYIVKRSPTASADDPLFETSPRWGVVLRVPDDALLGGKADQTALEALGLVVGGKAAQADVLDLQASVTALNGRAVPLYASRDAAVAAAPSLPENITHIEVREGTALVIRSRTAFADDPLFTEGARWGVVQRQDTASLVTQKADVDSPVLTGQPKAPHAGYDYADDGQIASMRSVLNLTRGYMPVNVSAHVDGVYTLTDAEARYPVVNFTGTPGAAIVVEIPEASQGLKRTLRNAVTGGYAVTVRHVGQSGGLVVSGGAVLETISNGNSLLAAGVASASQQLSGTPTTPTAAFTASDLSQVANIDAVLRWTRGYLSRNISSHTDGVYTLTEAEAHYPVINFTGALTQDVTVVVPQTTPAISRIVRNGTTGGRKVTVMHPGQVNLRVELPNQNEAVQTISNGGFILAVGASPSLPSVWPSDELVAVTSANQVDIYVPSGETGSNRYFLYPFVRSINTDRGADVWRWQRCYEATRTSETTFTTGQEVVTNGESETAIQIAGKSDFMGGLAHGDEIHTSITMLIDGVVRPMAAGTYRAKRIEFMQASNLFEPDVTPARSIRAAVANKHWKFDSSGVDVTQHIVWDGVYSLTNTYLAMCAALREAGGAQITDTGFRAPTWAAEDVSEAGFPQVRTQADAARLSGPRYSVAVDIMSGWDKPDRGFVFSPASLYNKLYFDFTGSYTTAVGEEMVSRAHYRIDGRS